MNIFTQLDQCIGCIYFYSISVTFATIALFKAPVPAITILSAFSNTQFLSVCDLIACIVPPDTFMIFESGS